MDYIGVIFEQWKIKWKVLLRVLEFKVLRLGV